MEGIHPRPPFKIKLPKTMKSNPHALPGNKISHSTTDTKNAEDGVNGGEKEKIFVEAYIPADPGPYPQDQPKQNSVKFTPTQVK